MTQTQATKYFLAQWLIGCLLFGAFFFVVSIQKMGQLRSDDFLFLGTLCLTSLFLYAQANIYINKSRFDFLFKIFVYWALALSICIAAIFLLKKGHHFSRMVIFQLSIVGFLLQIIGYIFVKWVFIYFGLRPIGVENVVVLGRQNFNDEFAKSLLLRRNERLIGYINHDDHQIHIISRDKDFITEEGGKPILHSVFEQYGIKKIYLVAPAADYKYVIKATYHYSAYPVELDWYLVFSGEMLGNELSLLPNFPFVQLSRAPHQSSPLYGMLKRCIDFILGVLVVILLSPLLFFVAILIKVTSKGPIIFCQKRHGLYGREITVFKFRTMYTHQANQLVQAVKGDPRITPIGGFLRKSSIDELPQLFNVIGGSMSLVGPRPHPIEFDSYYGPSISEYMMRHRIKPGITGLAQVYGARGETESTEKMLRRIKYDLEYISNRSIILDLKILFLTPFALITHLGH